MSADLRLSAPPGLTNPERRLRVLPWAGLILLLVVLWFVKLPGRPLAHPDEGRYAEIPREMVVTGDWVTLRLNGFAYFQRPPLQYWAAAAYETFGVTEWTARLWTALTGPLAVLAYFLSRQASEPGAERRWMVVAWAAMGLAVLSNGLIGALLPLATLGACAIWHRQPGAAARLHWLPGLAVFATITVPWFVLAARTNAGFLEFFLLHQHFQRFTSTAYNRAGSSWYFVPILLLSRRPGTRAGSTRRRARSG